MFDLLFCGLRLESLHLNLLRSAPLGVAKDLVLGASQDERNLLSRDSLRGDVALVRGKGFLMFARVGI